MVRQFRHGIWKVTTELPAGGIEGPISGQSLDDTEYLQYLKLSSQEIDPLLEREEFYQAIHVMGWLMGKQGEASLSKEN